jgi:hypothetical protein
MLIYFLPKNYFHLTGFQFILTQYGTCVTQTVSLPLLQNLSLCLHYVQNVISRGAGVGVWFERKQKRQL